MLELNKLYVKALGVLRVLFVCLLIGLIFAYLHMNHELGRVVPKLKDFIVLLVDYFPNTSYEKKYESYFP